MPEDPGAGLTPIDESISEIPDRRAAGLMGRTVITGTVAVTTGISVGDPDGWRLAAFHTGTSFLDNPVPNAIKANAMRMAALTGTAGLALTGPARSANSAADAWNCCVLPTLVFT